jgi:hypothetical protein
MGKKLVDNVNTQSSRIEEQSSHSKGEEFEIEFANFMQKNLGYEKTINRRNVPSAQNGRGTNVDIIGFKTDPKGKENKNLGVIFVMVALVGIVLKAFYTIGNQMDDASLSTMITFFLLILFLLGCFFIYNGRALESRHAWVECKNLKGTATYNHLTIMFEQYKNYQDSGDSKYKFKDLYFVSANGFVDNALEYAKQKKIKCFIKNANGKFIEV